LDLAAVDAGLRPPGSRAKLAPVSLSQLEYFVAVAEEGHVGRASRRLRVAQPAVSRQIHKLEDELGAPLFERTPRGMRLSKAGAVFLGHARAILGGVQAARAAMVGDADR
jgi:DNA-binding transcriptional LysR family regulator